MSDCTCGVGTYGTAWTYEDPRCPVHGAPADREWTCAWCQTVNRHGGVICTECSRYGQPPSGAPAEREQALDDLNALLAASNAYVLLAGSEECDRLVAFIESQPDTETEWVGAINKALNDALTERVAECEALRAENAELVAQGARNFDSAERISVERDELRAKVEQLTARLQTGASYGETEAIRAWCRLALGASA